MHRLRGLVVIGALAVVVSVVAAGPAAAAKGGNNDTAKACQKGGWKTLVPDADGTFANQGDCVNDGAQGRAPFAGQAACAQVTGTFVVDGVGAMWECNHYSPTDAADNSLADACFTDGGISFESGGNDFNTEHSGSCVPPK